MNDGSAIDLNIFTINIVANQLTLSIFSDDITEVGTYTFKVGVYYAGYPSVIDDEVYSVVIIDACSNAATATAPTSTIPN